MPTPPRADLALEDGARPMDDRTLELLRLSRIPGLGPRAFQRLVKHCGSIEQIAQATCEELSSIEGISHELARRVASRHGSDDAREESSRCQQHDVHLVGWHDPSYPLGLRHLDDPPILLYRQGEYRPNDQLAVAIVGTRHATHYGRRMAEQLAVGLAARGVTIVSGLARGIDATAHRAALSVRGRTVAVLAGGLARIYPPEHRELATEVCEAGSLFSESSLLQTARRGCFPRRNRIISGLSLGVIVVEAAERSGALVTARHAVEQGREVFAVPGPVDSRNSRGCHRLIREGAKLIETVDDVLDELGPLSTAMEVSLDDSSNLKRLPLSDQERCVLKAIDPTPTLLDLIIIRCGLPAARVLATVSVLETRGLARRLAGNRVERRGVHGDDST